MKTTSGDHSVPANIYDLLGNQRRRLVIGYLSLFEPGTTVEVRHIARVVRGIETETPPRQVSTEDYESAYNGLIQTHLPKLATLGLIEYDERRKVVVVTQRLEQYALIATITRFITALESIG